MNQDTLRDHPYKRGCNCIDCDWDNRLTASILDSYEEHLNQQGEEEMNTPKDHPLMQFPVGPRDERPRKYGWAPGMYHCKCVSCEVNFIGDKRAYQCADCAYKEDGRVINQTCANCAHYGEIRSPIGACILNICLAPVTTDNRRFAYVARPHNTCEMWENVEDPQECKESNAATLNVYRDVVDELRKENTLLLGEARSLREDLDNLKKSVAGSE